MPALAARIAYDDLEGLGPGEIWIDYDCDVAAHGPDNLGASQARSSLPFPQRKGRKAEPSPRKLPSERDPFALVRAHMRRGARQRAHDAVGNRARLLSPAKPLQKLRLADSGLWAGIGSRSAGILVERLVSPPGHIQRAGIEKSTIRRMKVWGAPSQLLERRNRFTSAAEIELRTRLADEIGRLVAQRLLQYGLNWVSPSLPRCPGVAGTRWLDDGVVGRGSNGEGLLGEAMKEQPAGL